MRIIGGKYKGRVLHSPKGLPVRPTTDRTKEALFNILNNLLVWEETAVLDLFSGTGNISLECWSRGADKVVSVDRHPRCIQSIRQSMKALGIEEAVVIKRDVGKFLKQSPEAFGLVFMDPPYALDQQEAFAQTIQSQGWLRPDGLLVAEHSTHRDYSGLPGHEFSRVYGSSTLSFFRP
ncbi:MAG: 16S rRNA (guanine(966)-N(2))-methyltransferase RsmD [Bacteroidota bacterium]